MHDYLRRTALTIEPICKELEQNTEGGVLTQYPNKVLYSAPPRGFTENGCFFLLQPVVGAASSFVGVLNKMPFRGPPLFCQTIMNRFQTL